MKTQQICFGEYVSIANRPSSDQPREKLIAKGPQALSNAELLALIIHHGTYKKSAIDLAQDILYAVDNNISMLSKIDFHQFLTISGIGDAKAARIIATMELARRKEAHREPPHEFVNNPAEIESYLRPHLQHQTKECFYTLYLSHSNRVMRCSQMSVGGLTATVVDPRVVFKEAVIMGATRLVISHNHPSGNLKPSQADIQITKRLLDAGKLFDIELLDHIIMTDTGSLSLREAGYFKHF
jgi:DNA repair protein RadC